MPRYDLRFRRPTREGASDKELFEAMPAEDNWVDGRMQEVVFYLAANKRLHIPDSWQDAMGGYLKQLREQAPRLKFREVAR